MLPEVAANSRRWWRNSGMLLNAVLTLNWSNRLGLPRLLWPQLLEPPGTDPHAGWCGRGATQKVAPYAVLTQHRQFLRIRLQFDRGLGPVRAHARGTRLVGLPLKADMVRRSRHVSNVPRSDIEATSMWAFSPRAQTARGG
jgi:hypothetical protein